MVNDITLYTSLAVIDFNTAVIEVLLQPGQTTVNTPIDVVNDLINEFREGFVAILEVIDALDQSVIDITQRGVTQCNIGDDDGKCRVFRVEILGTRLDNPHNIGLCVLYNTEYCDIWVHEDAEER